jgi:hypothetical protein
MNVTFYETESWTRLWTGNGFLHNAITAWKDLFCYTRTTSRSKWWNLSLILGFESWNEANQNVGPRRSFSVAETCCLRFSFKFTHSVTESTERVVTLLLHTQKGVSSNFGTNAGCSVSCFFFRFQQEYSWTLVPICPLHFLPHPLQFIIHLSFKPLFPESVVKRDVNK